MDSDVIMDVGYYAVIPAEVRYSDEINSSEKLLYGEISALCDKTGSSWATNAYFAQLYNVSVGTVSRWISHLKDSGFIEVHMVRDDDGMVDKRYLSITPLTKMCTPYSKMITPPTQKCEGGIHKNVKYNNTSINNTSITKERNTKERKPDLALGEFKNVHLTFKELDKLKDRFFDWESRIENLSAYKKSSGRRYKNDYATILVWARKEESVPEKEEKKEGDVYDGF